MLRVVQVLLAKLIADVDQLQHREQPEPFVPGTVQKAEITDRFGAGLLRGGLFGLRGAAFFGVRHVVGAPLPFPNVGRGDTVQAPEAAPRQGTSYTFVNSPAAARHHAFASQL